MRKVIAGTIVALVAMASMAAVQFPTPIAQAIALLTSGTTPFSIVGVNANGYINWGTARSASGYGFRDLNGVMQVKDSGGDWANFTTSGGAPSTATYITQTPNASLSNEQALSVLPTALMVNTTTSGIVTTYAGTTCTNQVVTALSALGVATCASVSPSFISGTLTVPNGGTGATTLTGMLQGNGAAAVTGVTSVIVGQVLRVTGSNTFAWGPVNLADTDAITGTMPVANGGTGITTGTSGGVLAFTAAGTIASSGALTANRIVLGGGAGAAPTVLGSLGTTTTVLHGNAAGAPTFAAVDITADTTGNLAATRGGTGQTSYAVGDVLYANTTTSLAKLASVAAGRLLRAGGVSTAPSWSTNVFPNTATTGDLLQATGANTIGVLTAPAAGSFLRSGGVATVSAWSTATWPDTATTGDLLYASGANTYANLTAVATGRVLGSAGVGTAPAWLTNVLATTYEAVTAFIGPGTEASAGDIRLQNTGLINARNAGDTADVTLIQATSGDFVQVGDADTAGFQAVAGSGTLRWRMTTPTISSGFGTTPSIAGIASAFKVTVGSGGDTTGVVLFDTTWPTAPVCVANNETTAQLVRATPTTTQVTLSGTMTAADTVAVYCTGF